MSLVAQSIWCYIIGITGNEKADKLARKASSSHLKCTKVFALERESRGFEANITESDSADLLWGSRNAIAHFYQKIIIKVMVPEVATLSIRTLILQSLLKLHVIIKKKKNIPIIKILLSFITYF